MATGRTASCIAATLDARTRPAFKPPTATEVSHRTLTPVALTCVDAESPPAKYTSTSGFGRYGRPAQANRRDFSYPAGGVIYDVIRREPFGKSAVGGGAAREGCRDRSLWLIRPGFPVVFFARPLERFYLPAVLAAGAARGDRRADPDPGRRGAARLSEDYRGRMLAGQGNSSSGSGNTQSCRMMILQQG